MGPEWVSGFMTSCVCGSKKDYSLCCEPLLKGETQAKTIRQLVRSRYAAYALGDLAEYLRQTWHPATAESIRAAELNTGAFTWQGLEIIGHEQKGDFGQVEFIASYEDTEGMAHKHHEISLFRRAKGKWYYLSGKVLNPD
jgi:SEC-C motif-containing protein